MRFLRTINIYDCLRKEGSSDSYEYRSRTMNIERGLDEGEFDGTQHFQVNIVILEARHLAVANSDSKVVVSIGNRRKTLRSKTAKTDAPYFNELCIFNFYLPLSVLLDEILKIKIYGVTKLRRNRLIGSFSVELATIWVQPNHQFYHKWAALTDPKNPAAGVKGYLKCDIGLLTQGTKSRLVDRDPAENIEDHLLVPYGEVNDRQRAKFVFSVFRADNFSNYVSHQPLRSLYAYVRITYAGISGKTSVATNTFNPFWNEELAFVDMIPALCQYVHIEICDAFKTTSRGILGTANLDLRKLSHESENGFLPTYGPAFLYLYQNFGKFERHNKCCFVNSSFTYMCRLLMALRTEVVDYAEDVLAKKANMLVIKPKSIPSLDESKYFEYEEFIFFAVVFDILLFDASIVTSKLSVRVNIGPDKPVQNDLTLKPSVELKTALKKRSDYGEDKDEDKISLKSKKTVTFENEENSLQASYEILGEEESNEERAKSSEFPEFSAPDAEGIQPKRSSGRQRLKFGEWKPLKDLEHWPSTWRFGNKRLQVLQSRKLKNWKIYNSTREWKPLKELQNWPTDWRQRRKNDAFTDQESDTSSAEERKPAKRTRLGRSPNDWKPIKRLHNWHQEWKGTNRKTVSSDTEKTESESSTVNIDRSVILSNISEEDDNTVSEHLKSSQSDEERQIIQSRARTENSNHKNEEEKSRKFFTESFALSKPFKSQRTWHTKWKARTGNKRSQNSEKEKLFGSNKNNKSHKRSLRDRLNERRTKPRIISTEEREYWKKAHVTAAEWKEKTRKYSGQQLMGDSEGKYTRVKRKLRRKDPPTVKKHSSKPDQNASINKKTNSLRWKGSIQNWKTAKILKEWPADWKRMNRKRNSQGAAALSAAKASAGKLFTKSKEWREIKRISSSSNIEETSSSTEVEERNHRKRRKLSLRRKQLAQSSDILNQKIRNIFGGERESMNSRRAAWSKRKTGERKSNSSETNVISDRSEKKKFCNIKKMVTSLGEWPTECRIRGKFRERETPVARGGKKGSKLRRFKDKLTKKHSQSSLEEDSLVESMQDYQTSSDQNTDNLLSVLPAQTEPPRPLPINEEIPISRYISEDSISLDTSFIFNSTKRTDSEETLWSQQTIWPREQKGSEETLSEHSLIENTEEEKKKMGNGHVSDKEKRSAELSEEKGGIVYTDFEKKNKETSAKVKDGKDGRKAYKSVERESSTLDESDTSTETDEPPSRKLRKGKKKFISSLEKSSESSLTTDTEEHEIFDKINNGSDQDTSSGTSSDDEETSSEIEDRRKCILKKHSEGMDSNCNACFKEALSCARSKKRYWHTRNERKPAPRLFSPKNTTENNIKVYFTFKNNLGVRNENLKQGGLKNVTDNSAEVARPRKLKKEDRRKHTERKLWKFLRGKLKKPSSSEDPDGAVNFPSENEIEESERKDKNKKQNNAEHEGSSLSSNEELPSHQVDELEDVNTNGKNESLQDMEIENEEIIAEIEKGKPSSSLDEEAAIKQVTNTGYETDNDGENKRKMKKIWHKKIQKQEDKINAEHKRSSSNDKAILNGKDEMESKEKEVRKNGQGSSTKQRKWRFWSRKKKVLPKPKKALKFSEKDDIRAEESRTAVTKEVRHVRIYNGCNTIAPQSVMVREHYGYTTFSGKYPCLHVNGEWPNGLRRMYRSNIIQKSITNLKRGINDVENEVTSENKIEASEKLKNIFHHLSEDCREILDLTDKIESEDTNLYRERKRYYHREMREIISKAEKASKKKVLIAEDELKRANTYLSTLQRYAQDPEDSFPDTEIWLVKDGKTVAQHRMRTQKIAFSPDVNERGLQSGKIQSVIVRGREGQEVAKLELFMWFGLGNHFVECRNMLPSGFEHEQHLCRGTAIPGVPLLLSYKEVHYFECRVHLFQARILVGADANGLADPFVRVIILDNLKDSQIQKETLNPTWDETIVFSNLTLYGPADYIKDNPITITVEVIDYDYLSKNELIGRTLLKPVVKLNYEAYEPPKLMWEDIRKECSETGKILLTAELLELSEAEHEEDENHGKTVPIPKDIRPHLVGHRLEVLFWGVRELKKKSPGSTRVFVTLECGGKYLYSSILKNTTKGLNFPGTVQILDLELPEEHDYKPPLIIKLFQTNPLVPGYEIYLGNCIIPSVKAFFCTAVDDEERKRKEIAFKELLAETNRAKKVEENEALAREKAKKKKEVWKRISSKLANVMESIAAVFVKSYKRVKCKIQRSCADVEASHLLDYEEDETLDWWVKYYASKEHRTDSTDTETLVIYEEELEAQPEFRGFSDFIYTFNMVTGKLKKNVESQILVGKVKAALKLYRWPLEEGSYHTLYGVDIKKGILKQLPSNAAIKYVARIYVISCRNLTPKDLYGKSDPYLILQIGKQRINDEKNYIPKQVNPIFGRCFEFRGIFPKEHLLRIKVMDHDILTKDDLIGETFIDLESRYYTKHHASCGLPKTYSKTGYTAWRDVFPPTEILKTVCKQSNMEQPVYTNDGVRIGEYEFRAVTKNEKYKDEMHALAALKKWHEIPLHGFHLVPEHIETRALYHPSFPGVEQGKIEMWIDIFPADFRYVPPIVDIEPRKPVAMELRAIVWNVEGVILDDTTLFFNEKMSDIYVQGWLNAVEEDKQATDVHYRSMNGEGNFNWRFIFPFKYIATERRLVVYKKQNILYAEPEEMKFPCRLELQVWDNDFLSDDFLGSLNLELSSMPRGAKISTRCKLSMFEETTPKINLFKIRRTRGWWPFRRIIDAESSEYSLTGKIDLELEVMTEKEAEENPVGKGREGPKALPFPKRPESSFIWFLNPLKTCRYIICRKYGKYLITVLVIVMAVTFVLLGIYAFPGYAVKIMLGA